MEGDALAASYRENYGFFGGATCAATSETILFTKLRPVLERNIQKDNPCLSTNDRICSAAVFCATMANCVVMINTRALPKNRCSHFSLCYSRQFGNGGAAD